MADEFKALTLDDLDVIATLGVGGFGRVDLVSYNLQPRRTRTLIAC